MVLRAASPVRTLEVEDGDGKVTAYKFGLTWGAWAKLSDALGCETIDDVQKELSKPPTQKMIDALLLATALPPITTKEDLDAFVITVSPDTVIQLFTEIMEAASPPPGVAGNGASPTGRNRAERRAAAR
jgi:hypothetical protein